MSGNDLSLKWPGGPNRPPKGPRQVLGPYGRAYEPTGHLRDMVQLTQSRSILSTLPSSVSVYLGAPLCFPRAVYRSTVDGFVPRTQRVNLPKPET
jgi:hypothetical protein